jgi:hypothetical protein
MVVSLAKLYGKDNLMGQYIVDRVKDGRLESIHEGNR